MSPGDSATSFPFPVLPQTEAPDRSMSSASVDTDDTIPNDQQAASPKSSTTEVEKTDEVKVEAAAPVPFAPYFPDGGRQAWIVTFGGWCSLCASFGWIMCMGVFQDYYEHEKLSNYSSSTIAWIPSVQVCIMFLGAPVFGKIFDSYGPRYLMIGGTLFHVFGLMMLSISHSYYQIFLSQGICSAIGTSALFYGGNNTVGRWFSKRRALAVGLVSSGSSFGGMVISLMASRLLPRIGFGWTVRAIAFIYLGLLIVANLTIKTRLEHKPTPLVLKAFFRPFRQRAVALTAAASFFFFLGVFIPYDFLIVYARRQGYGTRWATNLIVIANGTSVLGRIVPSWAGDKVGRFNIITTITALSAIFALAMWIPSTTDGPLIAFAVLYGFVSGSFVAMIPACVAQLSPVSELGLRLGTNSLPVAVATLVGNPIAGALIEAADGSFIGAQLFAGLVMIIGSVLFGFARLAQESSLKARV